MPGILILIALTLFANLKKKARKNVRNVATAYTYNAAAYAVETYNEVRVAMARLVIGIACSAAIFLALWFLGVPKVFFYALLIYAVFLAAINGYILYYAFLLESAGRVFSATAEWLAGETQSPITIDVSDSKTNEAMKKLLGFVVNPIIIGPQQLGSGILQLAAHLAEAGAEGLAQVREVAACALLGMVALLVWMKLTPELIMSAGFIWLIIFIGLYVVAAKGPRLYRPVVTTIALLGLTLYGVQVFAPEWGNAGQRFAVNANMEAHKKVNAFNLTQETGKANCGRLKEYTTWQFYPVIKGSKVVDWRGQDNLRLGAGTGVMYVNGSEPSETTATGRAYVLVNIDTPDNPGLSRNPEEAHQYWLLTTQVEPCDCGQIKLPPAKAAPTPTPTPKTKKP